jgi:hypothetical protein
MMIARWHRPRCGHLPSFDIGRSSGLARSDLHDLVLLGLQRLVDQLDAIALSVISCTSSDQNFWSSSPMPWPWPS